MSYRDSKMILADMGTGKTAITLTHIVDILPANVLIIAPLRVCELVWEQEAKQWEHTRGLTFSKVLGTGKQRVAAMDKQANVHLINIENTQWLIKHYDLKRFDTIIFDELSLWKGGGKRFKAIWRHVRHAQRIGLTGSPVTNGLLKIWPMVKLIDEELLPKTREGFKRKYFYPTDYMQYNWEPLPFAQEKILAELDEITFRIENDLSSMPELVYDPIRVKLPPQVLKQMRKFEREQVMEIGAGSLTASSAAVLTGKVQQMSNGRIYDEDGNDIFVHKAKVDACKGLVESLNEEPVIIAYTYNHDLVGLKEAFPEAPVMGDDLNAELVAAWNCGRIPVILGHPGAFGHGLNIQKGGHHLIWFGLNWDLDYFDQTIARLWRHGQMSEGVFIHILIGDDTIDESIFEALRDKRDVQQVMLDYYT